MSSRTINVDYLARVEGEGGLTVKMKDGAVTDVAFNIFEPPRFFEAFLRGRDFREAPDITARICGICPVAYQMSSCHAMERALGVTVDGQLRALRRLIYCGEWIESHALHVFMLHAPDFLGFQDAIQMAKQYPTEVQTGLRIKKIGNELMRVVGGREIHPINVKVGGFYKAPDKKDLVAMIDDLTWAREASLETVKLLTTFTYPDLEMDYEFVAMRHPDEYPFNEGRLVSTKGIDIDIADFDEHFLEEHVSHSTSLHARIKKRGAYHVGPLARYSLNFDRLPKIAKDAARNAGLGQTCTNPFKSIIVRAVETVYACDEALRIIDQYEKPKEPAVEITPRAGIGYGCSEAPRGLCWHRYELDEKGLILDARIVPPTSQNQAQIEKDLRAFVENHIDLPRDQLQWQCEQVVRNYDPCISCSCHFLKLKILEESSDAR